AIGVDGDCEWSRGSDGIVDAVHDVPVDQVRRLRVADVVEGIRIAIDATTAGEEQSVAPAFELQNRAGSGQPARAGRRDGGRIVESLEDTVVGEVNSVSGLGQPKVGDVVVDRGAERVVGIVAGPESVAELRSGKSGGTGDVALQDLLFINNLQW